MYRISKDSLGSLLSAINAKRKLYVPADNSGLILFTPYSEELSVNLSRNPDVSAKDFFFPQVENICRFKVCGKSVDVIDNREKNEDFVMFGVRACDVKSFEVLDRVFLSEPVDGYYKDRRDHSLIITLACSKPLETCFCRTFGIDCAAPGGDVEVYDCGDSYVFNAVTEKGAAFIAELPVENGGDADAAACKDKINAIMPKLPLSDLTTDGFGGGKTKELFSNPKWAELSESCLGCGTCTFVCPTCQCYDIRDFDTGNGIQRYRCWDSCMYRDFTKMSAGQPRPSQLERFRQRFMHKLVYYPENNEGLFSCVGCGRCLRKCPQSLNIVKVMKALKEEN